MRLDPARWDAIQGLFHAAADLPEAEQRAFLEAHTGDPGLIADVLALIDADARDASLLSRGVAGTASDVLGAPPLPGLPLQEFGPYRIVSVLGEGGMGVVYLAERTDLGSLVAIKILRDAWLSPARRERFANEQRTLAQLNHPAIARLYDADTLADGTPGSSWSTSKGFRSPSTAAPAPPRWPSGCACSARSAWRCSTPMRMR